MPALITEGKAQIVYRFAVVRVGVAFLKYFYRFFQVLFSYVEASFAYVPQSKRVVAANVVGVAPQAFFIIIEYVA